MAFLGLLLLTVALGSALSHPGNGLPKASGGGAANAIPDSNGKDQRVVNGQPCERHQFPWLAGILVNGRPRCTGALISNRTVLTAAHCVGGTSTFDITLGDHDLNNATDQDVVVRSTRAIAHEGFDMFHLDNDIAVIILPEAILESENVSYARLPPRVLAGQTFEDMRATIAGFGTTGDYGVGPAGVCNWAANRAILSNADCKKKGHGDRIREGHICISTSDGTGVCSGDSGSMLMLQTGDRSNYHVGVASFVGMGSCRDGLPHVFVRTTHHLDWIEKHGEGVVIEP